MEPSSHVKSLTKGEIHYSVFGSGPKTIFVFHGYRDRFKWYEGFADGFQDVKLILIHLPHHGATQWEDSFISKPELSSLIETLSLELEASSFGLLGYSMGGRIASSLAPAFLKKLDGLILVAPEGFGTGNSIDSSKIPLFFRKLINQLLRVKPKWFDMVLGAIMKSKMLTKASLRFLEANLVDQTERKQLMDVWLGLYEYKIPDFGKELGEKTLVFLGEKDQIIPYGKLKKRFTKDKIEVIPLALDHRMIKKETGLAIAKKMAELA